MPGTSSPGFPFATGRMEDGDHMKVGIIKDELIDYCREAPFHPEEMYPEYPFEKVSGNNSCYRAVRELFRVMGLDRDHFGSAEWNPLGEIVKPGSHVFIKPNLVRHYNDVGGIEPLITQGSVIRAVLDYVHIALKGCGTITIGDSPYLDADFAAIVRRTDLDWVVRFYQEQGITIELADLRCYRGQVRLIGGLRKEMLSGDSRGYSAIDLKEDSDHSGITGDCEKFRNGYYDRREMLRHHNKDHHEYYIANSILNADVVINIPKLKTHSKAGMTCALKNLVGINGLKDWLPHHRAGSAESGGDDYPRGNFRKDLLARLRDEQVVSNNLLQIMPLRMASAFLLLTKKVVPFKDSIDAGGWHGNDTIPRTISDLNRILFYADKHGRMTDRQQRKMFVVVDGILGGQKEGPLIPEPKKCGVLVAGGSPVEVDLVCSRIMGFDYRKMPAFRYAMQAHKYPLYDGKPESIEITSQLCDTFDGVFQAYNCSFEPAAGWKGFIEYDGKESSPGQIKAAPLAMVTAADRKVQM